MSARTLRRARAAVTVLVALDLVALASFAVHRTATVTTTRVPQTAAAAVPGPGVEEPVVSAAPVPVSAPAVHAVVVPAAAVARPPTTVVTDAPAPRPATVPPAADPGPLPKAVACPLPLTVPGPQDQGGLQSLIGFAPLFGPFSAEAFAAASAYQPVLQLVGPVLARYPQLEPVLGPPLAAFQAAWVPLLQAGFDAVGPLYAPYREQVLQAEADLAAALGPYAQGLPASAGGACLIAAEAALLHAAGS